MSQDIGIGSSLMRNAPLSTSHPLFKSAATLASVNLKEVMQRESVRKRSTKRILCTVDLEAEQLATLTAAFPEFVLVAYGSTKPGHAYYYAARILANEWCATQIAKYTTSIAHFGGTASVHIQSGRHNVHILGDITDDVYAHAMHEAVLDATRITRDVASVSKMLGRVVPPVALLNFLNGKTLTPCSRGRWCNHEIDSLLIDGSMVAVSPHQVAASMVQMKSVVAYGFFPYSAAMLVSDEGRLDRTGVRFARVGLGEDARYDFIYPEGRCGVSSYPLAVWSSWVREQVITLGGRTRDKHFQLELLDNRGPFMFYRMVSLTRRPTVPKMMHALELPMNTNLYNVSSWRLKSVGCDPRSERSWEKFSFTAERRLIDQTYAFGMQLLPKDFSRFAIRKQLKIFNDRVVVNGSAVTWHAPLTPTEVDQLSIAIFSRLFIDRYDSGELSSELMAKLKSYSEFDQASVWKKLNFLATLCMTGVWDAAFGFVDEKIRSFCDAFHRYVNSDNSGKLVTIHRAPTYLPMETVAKNWFGNLTSVIVPRSSYPLRYVSPNLPGVLCKPVSMFDYPITEVSRTVFSDIADIPGIMTVVMEEGRQHPAEAGTRDLDPLQQEAMSLVAALNVLDYEPIDRHVDLSLVARRVEPHIPSVVDFTVDPDPIHSFNEVYDRCLPGNSLAASQGDMASNVLDPQDRNFSARYLRMAYNYTIPKTMRIYESNIRALNVTKRQDILTELVSAASARNMDPPVVSRPQNFEHLIPDIWRRFKRIACREDVEETLAKFRDDPVALGQVAFEQWMRQAKDSGVIKRIATVMADTAKAVEDYDVSQYIIMIKADVKVPLSTKPQTERTEPQVIVYHDKMLSAGYSAIFRVMVSRFLSILKPNIHINLRKDTKDIAGFINALHPFDELDTGQKINYLENDFSKYDKSQLELAFTLEKYIFEQLGMNQTFVDTWFLGHVDCQLRSLVHAFSLHVAWQRKSGDATTAFGNVMLNCMSVIYAYPMSKIYWMVFMGDDSIICAERIAGYEDAVNVLAEIFNLQAKTYITTSPYFASNFIVIDRRHRTVGLLPDPIKRTERWSMSVSEDKPEFDEKHTSAQDVCGLYRYKLYTDNLNQMVPERYNISVGDCGILSSAIATVISDKQKFRSIWKPEITVKIS